MLGFIIQRFLQAVGVMAVHAVLGEEDYRGAYRGTTMGSHHWVAVQRHDTLDSALQPLQAAGFQLVAAHLSPHGHIDMVPHFRNAFAYSKIRQKL